MSLFLHPGSMLSACVTVCLALHAPCLQAREEGALALDEILVVAQRREQSAMVVPLAVDVFSADDILNTGAVTLRNIDDYIPGFEVLGESATQQGLKVRGVSSSNISTGGDPSVATFYDEAYLPRAATTIAFSDMQRVEVLKGPQGTLFGRNAAVGVINMIPNAPSDTLEGFGRARLGTDDRVRLESMVNIPVTDNFFLRANALSNEQDGVADQLGSAEHEPGEREHRTARIAGLWKVNDTTRAQLSYDLDRLEKNEGLSFGYSEYAYSLDPFSGKVENDVINGEETRDMDAATGKLWHDFSPELTGKLILNYREINTSNRGDLDGTADKTRYLDADNRENSDIFYSEFQFNYSNESLNIVFGANYSREDTHQTTWLTGLADSVARQVTKEFNKVLGLDPPIDHLWNPEEYARGLQSAGLSVTPEEITATGDFWYEQIAAALGEPMIYGPSLAGTPWRERIVNEGKFTNRGVYFDMDYALNDQLTLIAGLRYSKDEKTFSWLIPPTTFTEVRPGVPNQIFTLPEGLESAAETPLTARDSWSKTTGRLVGQYQISDTLMTYLSYSTGYKSGGYDTLDIETALVPIEPEESTMYEWGIKGDLFEGTLRTQIAIYRLEIDNRQRSVESRPPGQEAAIPKVINGYQRFDGVEVTLHWLPIDSVKLGLVTSYRDQKAEWNAFYNSTGVLTQDKSQGDTAGNATITIDWTPPVPTGSLFVHFDYIYRENSRSTRDSDYYADLDALPGYFDDEKYLNGRIAWANDEGNWEFAVWGKNLTDREYIVDMSNTTRSQFGTPIAAINQPRSYGIEFAYTY